VVHVGEVSRLAHVDFYGNKAASSGDFIEPSAREQEFKFFSSEQPAPARRLIRNTVVHDGSLDLQDTQILIILQ